MIARRATAFAILGPLLSLAVLSFLGNRNPAYKDWKLTHRQGRGVAQSAEYRATAWF